MQRNQESAQNSSVILDLDKLSQEALEEYLKAIEPFDENLLQRQFQRQSSSLSAFKQEEDSQLTEDRELQELFQNSNWQTDTFNLPLST